MSPALRDRLGARAAALLVTHAATVTFLWALGPPRQPWLAWSAVAACLACIVASGLIRAPHPLPPSSWRFGTSCALVGALLAATLADWPATCARALCALWALRAVADALLLRRALRPPPTPPLAESAEDLAQRLTAGEIAWRNGAFPYLGKKGGARA